MGSLGHGELRRTSLPAHISPTVSLTQAPIMVGGSEKPVLKLKDMEEKHLHNLFLKNMSGLIEEVKNPTPRLNPNSKCGGMATHAGLALELGITRKKSLSPQMEAILIWCQCRTREYEEVAIRVSSRQSVTISLSVFILNILRTSHNPGPTVWPSVLSFTT